MIEGRGLIATLLIGLVAGWLAGRIVTGKGFGVLADILVGVVGAFFGSWLFHHAGIYLGFGIIGSMISSTVGSVVLLAGIKLIKHV